MYQFLGKGGEKGIRERRRRRRLFLILLLLLLLSSGITILMRFSIFQRDEVPAPDISDIIFTSIPPEDRAVRRRPPLDKSVWDELNKKQKDGTMTQKRIPPHPILEIIGPDGKTLLRKK